MRLEPVYLLAPEPEAAPRSSVTRRSLFSAIIGSFAVGALAGGFGARWLVDGHPGERIDESLSWALRLQEQSIEELLGAADAFLVRYVTFTDSRLEVGIRRLSVAVTEDSIVAMDRRRELAVKLTAVIQGTEHASQELRQLLPSLSSVR